jgi:hypothetical protein
VEVAGQDDPPGAQIRRRRQGGPPR